MCVSLSPLTIILLLHPRNENKTNIVLTPKKQTMESSGSSSASQSTNTDPNLTTTTTTTSSSSSSRRSRYSTLFVSTFGFLQAPLSTILSHYSPVTPLNPNDDDVSQLSIRIVPGQERNHELGLNTSSANQQRYDLQQAARLIDHIIPFSFLLLLLFIRQHLQGFLFFLLSLLITLATV